MIDLQNIQFKCTEPVDPSMEARLPEDLRTVLHKINGFTAFRGGLHVRGACVAPSWHSLETIWDGKFSLRRTYELLGEKDIPFAEDCMGDQFILRDGMVYRLTLETAFLDPLGLSLDGFFASANEDPVEFLQMHPLLRLEKEGKKLEPGQLIHAFPPYCTKESAQGVSLKAVEANAQIDFELDFFRQIRDIEDGGQIRIRVID
ncbi:MAG TPA: hypothetical protein PKE49_01575 [Leptospiraceae bacterium]|nr:SMI1/KNR4 family protein [Leptospirales bacterium]HMW60734.1 hypothetical protein [Leptospiraceae bacterium]HMX55178.1 hypothetical protein [Leptospiraceae bacterium]HMY45157.1 hypothetical protein [Leptospiraceae bacterium]HNE23034.1 hypothetical protein [Leptospiraceae bacterium]